ncbi:integrase, catalytic core [Purpureocillium lavendulum]|uniref:Integrase, catalytic core n=1 Tax=Purpureocillium lavendulum TaxID=1247861 RepID=A0AB34FD77_9HYPO|nr:integrase, catalytic core [Purpureocillium lavendulum]
MEARYIISRRESANRARQPFYRVFADLFEFPAAYNGHRYILLITDEFSGMMFSWSLSSKTETGGIIMEFEARIKRHTGASIYKIRIDNEGSVINLPLQTISEFQRWAKKWESMSSFRHPTPRNPRVVPRDPGESTSNECAA